MSIFLAGHKGLVGSAILKKVLDDPTNKPVYNFVKNLKGRAKWKLEFKEL